MTIHRPLSRAGTVRVLVAEDSPTQAQRLRHLLERRGYEVAVAGNGRIALEIAAQFRPHLVISDVVMPEMDGYELVWHVKADPALAGVPVILVTTMSEPQDVIRGLECGADNFLLKPYEESYLLSRVDHALDNRGSQLAGGVDPVEIRFNGERHHIVADRLQILNLLLSTYEAAIQRNKDLHRSQEELRAANRQLDAANAQTLAANRFLDSVIRNIPDVVFVKDAAELRFVRLNRAGEQLFGYRESEVVGKTVHDLFPAELAESLASADRDALARGSVTDIPDVHIVTRPHGARILHTRKIPICDEKQRPVYLIGIAKDVTEQRQRERDILRLNEALAQRAAEVEAANRELDAFSASVSHDLRAPLRHIGAYVEMLADATAGQLSPEAQGYLDAIAKAGRHMDRLIEALLDFSRMKRSEMRVREVDLNGLVDACRSELSMAIGDRRVEWHVEPLPNVVGDAQMLHQVFYNLLGNAVKYTRPRQVGKIRISSQRAGDEVVVSVCDNGVGFDMAQGDKLFEVFQRLHRPDEFEGTGIGLANVRRIVERHRGRTWAESRLGEGASFHFSLPAMDGLGKRAESRFGLGHGIDTTPEH